MAPPIVRPGFGDSLMPRDISDFVFEKAAKESVMMQVVRKIPLPGNGVAIPVVTGKPSAGWVSEAGRKPVSDATVGTKTMDPKKLAVVVPFSKEYIRDERIGLFEMIRPMIAEAFAMAFDSATIKGTSTPFSTYVYQTTNSVELGTTTQANGGLYGDFVASLGTVADETGKDYRVDTFVLDQRAEVKVLGATDTTGRALFAPSGVTSNLQNFGAAGSVLGRPLYYSSQAFNATGNIQGFGFDSSQFVMGVAEDIGYDITDQATIVLADGTTTLHLWQNNLVALLAEAEFGFLSNDVQAGVKIADNV